MLTPLLGCKWMHSVTFAPRTLLVWGLMLLSLLGCSDPPPNLQHQAYIWQRQWTAQHDAALAASKTDFNTLRVLALQIDLNNGTYLWQKARVALNSLQQDGRPVILVVRIDGRISELQHLSILWQLKPLLQSWQAAGIQVSGVEIDYDSPRSQLPLYQAWLRQLKSQLPPAMPLQITALPDWLLAGEFPELAATVDGVTLQLHSILSPEQGLFDIDVAKAWVRQLQSFELKTFNIALPAYHSALINTPSGWQVESEVPVASAGPRQEMYVAPATVAEFLAWLQRQNPEGLAQVVWFRLPLATDQRAWPLATLQAVIRQQELKADVTLQLTGTAPLFELNAYNQGNSTGVLPSKIQLNATDCEGMDALQAFAVQQQGDHISLQRQQNLGLAAGQQLELGWFRCQTVQLDD